jgi:glycerol-3-phosphate acyltransferase PlsX
MEPVRGSARGTDPELSPAVARLVAEAGHLPVAVDAMGGDHAPEQVVAGARLAVEAGIPVVLYGRPDAIGDAGDLPVVPASEVIAMDADPGASVRRLKDSSLVRAAEAVRDGHACAMVSAGNTGAAMAASLLRMGRIRGIGRPAIAIPIFTPGHHPTLLLDAGANAECQPDWLVQFAQMGAVYARLRYGIERPRVGLMSIGEESVKGNSLVKDTHRLMSAADDWLTAAGAEFIGNIEGRDLMKPVVDVAVTDGFTGNVTLKALEGMRAAMIHTLRASVGAAAFEEVHPTLASLDPENTGGGILLGVRGVSIISHGSSSAQAIANAIRLAQEMVRADVVGAVTALRGSTGDGDGVLDGPPEGEVRGSEQPQRTG